MGFLVWEAPDVPPEARDCKVYAEIERPETVGSCVVWAGRYSRKVSAHEGRVRVGALSRGGGV